MALGDMLGKLSDAASKGADLYGKCTDKFAEVQANLTKKDPGQHTMYETFSGGFITFALTENSLVFGKDEYPYSVIDEIIITNPPTQVRNGMAQTKANGKVLNLEFARNQAERFAAAATYANEQIIATREIVKTYRFWFLSTNGIKVEVYDDSLTIYAMKTGLGDVLSNAMRGGSTGTVLAFSEVNANVAFDPQTGAPIMNISMRDDQSGAVAYSLPLLAQDVEKAKEIATLVNSAQALEPAQAVALGEWKPVKGEPRTFTLGGEQLSVDPDMDEFNTYRQRFLAYADTCVEAASAEYQRRVRDLVTYLKFFPAIYGGNLDVLVKQAVGILILEGVYTVTEENFKTRQLNSFHGAVDALNVTVESMELTSQANTAAVQSVTSLVPNLIGGGFGTKGAIKGIAKAEAFNFIRNSAEDAMLDAASNIRVDQANELYGRINPQNLFELVRADYGNIFMTLVAYMAENGKSIWFATESQTGQAGSIFKNLSNPNFPQDKLTEMFVQILKTNPYDAEYQKFMVSKFGDNEETRAIRQYFGY